MAGIDNLTAVMGRDADMDHVERDRLCDEAAAEIERLRAALAAETEECARVADRYRELSCEAADKALERGDIDEHQEHAGDASIAKYIAAAIRARGR